ncbi:hypothetical protein BN873_350094 [Candidatus Competibacter denitrificans Run_A_D11]|uniref:Uncharacterized protein n=1 Tax=Candidatus Competibacter denitrificans Run_A_D11 TaxID=1400863 RepID=W6MDG8_9GAMM|nr:hypothetical protein [Candidatus Competibacter denitrificans]CDI02838.1 hypothetical protein BN873_350094 [Candidatus Competibacter denitrificans Run_A_D11]HRC69833.1 hypothetical protein [Candidatus Competibacter denitrificans]
MIWLALYWAVKGYTIGDIIVRVFGENIRFLVSAVLSLAWPMLLADQIIAGGNLLNAFVNNEILAYALFTLIFTVYTLLVGQAGTVKIGFLRFSGYRFATH